MTIRNAPVNASRRAPPLTHSPTLGSNTPQTTAGTKGHNSHSMILDDVDQCVEFSFDMLSHFIDFDLPYWF